MFRLRCLLGIKSACNKLKCLAIAFQGYQLLCLVVTRMYNQQILFRIKCSYFNKMQTWPTKVGHFIWTEEQSLNCNVEYRNALVYILKANNHCNLWFVYNAYLHLIFIIIATDVYAYICMCVHLTSKVAIHKVEAM